MNCSASEDNCAGGIAGSLAGWDFPAEITNCSVGSKNRSTVIKSLYLSNSNNKTYAGGIVGLIYDNTCSVVVTVVKNNYSRLKTAARYTDTLTYGNISPGSHYYYWPGVLADISNNIEVNPDGEPTYETTKLEIENGNLTVKHTGSSSDLTFSPIDGTNGTGFKIDGDFPEGLTIHLPAEWELDVDDGEKVTASDTSKVKEAKDVDGLESPAVKIIGSNDITLNESGIVMTAWYVGTIPTETMSWTKENGKLIVTTNGTPSRYEFDALTSPDTNGDGFKLTGFPAGLTINLPDKWGIDIDTSYSVTVSDESKIIPNTEIPGLPSTAHRIMGNNTITLNASDLEMTAFLFTAPKMITLENLGTFTAGEDISIQLQAEGTQWTMEWTHEGLPEGLSLSSTGLISGKISQEGTYKFKILVSNCAGTYIERFTMTVKNIVIAPKIINSEDLGTYTVGDKVSITLHASGTTPITWSVTSSDLPPRLSAIPMPVITSIMVGDVMQFITTDKTFLLISGTLTKAGIYSFTVTATNSAGSDSKTFKMTVKEYPSSIIAPSITTASLPDAKAGAIYTVSFDATGTAPIEWTSDNLPEGFTLGTSGNLAGLPKTAGVYKFTVTAANSAGKDSREFTLTVNAPKKAEVPKIITRSITEAYEGESYSFKLEAEGINLTWSSLNALPKNLTLSKEGIISGTPITAGTYRVIFVVKNSAGTDNAVLTLKVKSSSSNAKPKVKTAKLPDGFRDMDYSYQLEAEGTVDEWKLADGSTLPSGLELDTETGEISGVIAESSAKTFKFKVIAVNEAGESAAKNISIKITAQTPYFKTEDLKAATWNKSYSFTVKLANFKAVTWTIEGDMPEGLKFDKGKFSGKPQEVGEFDLTIRANNGSAEMEQDFVLRVNSIPPKFKGSFKTGTEGKYYECKLKATGSTPIEWDFSYLPEGLTPTIDATGETCIISGTPTEVFAQTIEIILTNGDNEGDSITTHKKMTIKAVKPRFATTAKDVPNGTVNESYSYQLQLKEGFIPANVTWDYNGNMPEGLELDQNGIIYGVPSKAVKNSRFTVFARNAAKESYFAKLAITMTINESEENTNLPAVKEDDAEDSKPEFVDGVAYYERGEISAEDSARLAGSNEIIAAYLPAVEVETENVYEFTVSLDVSAPEGGLLVWHSFPDGKYDDSESEAYFLDGEDSVIEYVPENHTVTVQAWLKPGIIYEPVIAVKISHKD